MQSPGNQQLRYADRTQHVIIAHHSDIFCRGLHSLLNATPGFEVLAEADSCEDLLAKTRTMAAEIVLVDCSLPGDDCIEAVRQLNELFQPPSIVVLAPAVNDELLLQALLHGASGYLTKDTQDHLVIHYLEGLRRGEMAMLPRITAIALRLLVWECQRLAASLSAGTPAAPTSASEETPEVDPSPHVSLAHLTQQEVKILHLLRQGLSNKQIAARLSISPYTVGKHVQNILRKLGASNRTQAVSHTSNEAPHLRYEE
jgi:DNA-binding NarL/FixJ family response regulator